MGQNDSQPNVQTLESAMTGAMQNVLGIGSDELAQYVPALVSLLKRLTGNDRAFGGLWSTNQTASGVWWNTTNSYVSQMASSVSNTYANQRMHAFFDTLERNLHSQDVFIKDNPQFKELSAARQAQEYDRYIEQQVQGRLSMPFVGTIYGAANKMFNIGDDYATAQGLGSLAATAAGWRIREGWTARGLSGGKALAEGLLKGGDFDPAQWGGMSSGGVAALAAELAKTTDFLAGYKGGAGQIDNAVEKLRTEVRNYTRAMSSLKDVFGNDMPKMINMLQGMTGQDISQLSWSRVRTLSERVSAALTSGQMSGMDLASLTMDMQGRLAQMGNLGPQFYLTAPQQAMAAKSVMSGAFQPSFMKKADFEEKSKYLVSQTHNSKAADLFAKAYALWANRTDLNANDPNRDRSTEAFEQAMLKEAGNHQGDLRAAAFALSGATPATINRGLGYAAYQQALDSGLAGALTMAGFVNQNASRGAMRAMVDPGFLQEAGGGDRQTALTRYNQMINLFNEAPDSIKWQEADLKAYLQKGTSSLGNLSDQEIAQLARALNFANNSTELSKVAFSVGALRNLRENRKNEQVSLNRRRALSDVNADILRADSLAELFKGGFSIEKLTKRLGGIDNAVFRGMDKGELTSLYEIAGLAIAPGGKTDVTDTARKVERDKEAFTHILSYLSSAEGMSNENVQAALQEYSKTTDKTAKTGIAARVAAYATAGPDLVNKLYALRATQNGQELSAEDSRAYWDQQLSKSLIRFGKQGAADAVREQLILQKARRVSTDGLQGAEKSAAQLFTTFLDTRTDKTKLDIDALQKYIEDGIHVATHGVKGEGQVAAVAPSPTQLKQWQALGQILSSVNNVPGGHNYNKDILELLRLLVDKLNRWLDIQLGTPATG